MAKIQSINLMSEFQTPFLDLLTLKNLILVIYF